MTPASAHPCPPIDLNPWSPLVSIIMLPLTLAIHNGKLVWNIDIPGVLHTPTPGGFSLKFTARTRTHQQYCHFVPEIEPDQEFIYYTTVHSTASPEKPERLLRWTRSRGVSVSPRFSVDSGEHETTIYATVLALRKPGRLGINTPRSGDDLPEEPPVLSIKSGVKTGGSGGGGDL